MDRIVHEVPSIAGKPSTVITEVRWEVSYYLRDGDPDILPLLQWVALYPCTY